MGVQSKKSKQVLRVLPDLLEMLESRGCLVTLDAMDTQTSIAKVIIDQGGDYVLALKGNHPRLCGDVNAFFEDAEGRKLPGMDLALDRQVDGGHGRIEVRRYRATDDIGWLAQTNRWPGLQRLAMVQAERQESQWDEEVGGAFGQRAHRAGFTSAVCRYVRSGSHARRGRTGS